MLGSGRRPLDLLTVSAGQMVETPPPRSAAEVARLGADGVSVVVRGAEAHDDGLAGLARSLRASSPARSTCSST